MTLSKKDIQSFQQMIFDWWKANRRDLPWRHTHDPYKIMVSEVMLQQTQVERVIAKYCEFIGAYPTVQSLAKAKTASILRLWKGMGYNMRALYLKQAAEAVLEAHKGVFPASERALMKLSGIGRYTARAILVFSFKQDIAMVDTNIRKIITHFFFTDRKQPEKVIQDVADQIVPKGQSWEWHQALMDYGAIEFRNLQIYKPASPAGRSTNQPIKRTPFNQTNRFFRGRIMDLVRKQSWGEKKLIYTMKNEYGREEGFYKKHIEKLLQEGLLARVSGNFISLPD